MAKNNMALEEALNQSAGTTSRDKDRPTTTRCAARQDKKLIGGHFDTDVHKQLKMMSFEEECSIQSLLGEALDYLFINRGKPPIASRNRRNR
ncbi:hypothetical protein F4X73_15245 [Candidatus Poribacteria bacterium]|nr:hypothetical protein [Candidatus Poribacteria bacterium]MYF56710.1 hypothetical protein [Candidatus Poribacteria bacterium]